MKTREVSKLKKGPATEAGRRRISLANTKSGMWSNAVLSDKKRCRELETEAIKFLQHIDQEFMNEMKDGMR